MGKSLDFVDACFAFYDEPSGGVALDWVEAGFLDMAVVCSTSFIGAAARGAKLAIVAVPFTDIESNVLVARNSHKGLSTFATSPHTPTRVWSTRSSSNSRDGARALARAARLNAAGGSGSTAALSKDPRSPA